MHQHAFYDLDQAGSSVGVYSAFPDTWVNGEGKTNFKALREE